MTVQEVIFRNLGLMDYQSAWDYQESLLQENIQIKAAARNIMTDISGSANSSIFNQAQQEQATKHYLLFVEHPPVYTLGKSGNANNILINDELRSEKGIEFFRTNRGGDITFHGPGQVVGYPILDLERFYTDIGRYLRNIEEVVIETLSEYGIRGERSAGETGVWIEPGVKGRERKICAIGVRTSRWITMHGFAFNVNTNLDFFNYIIPCGISNKQVTSLQKELGAPVDIHEARERLKRNFEKVFAVKLVNDNSEVFL